MMLTRIFTCFCMLVFFVPMGTWAQKADISSDEVSDEAKVALAHGYFLPAQALAGQKQISLTAEQVNKIKSIEATLMLKKTETDISAKRNEYMLDSLLRTGKVNEGVIIFYTNRYGLYQGEYRGAVLLACYNTRKVLTPAQAKKLAELQNHN